MIYSQFNTNIGCYIFYFVVYKNKVIDGTSKTQQSLKSFNDRSKDKYMSFHLELVC